MKLHLSMLVWRTLLAWALCAAGAQAANPQMAHAQTANPQAANPQAAPVSHLEVRIVTGAAELSAGSTLELRIYETGKVRRLPLLHGESWPPDSTHVIPVRLSDALDPRTVLRFGLYYHAGNPLAPALEIVSADVEIPSTNPPGRLLDAALSGVIDRQGELATEERDAAALTCRTDADCDDGRLCNGRERCAPHASGADVRGCVKGTPVACPVNQMCAEGVGCRGPDALKTVTAEP